MERAFFPILFESSVRKVFPTKKRQGAVAPPQRTLRRVPDLSVCAKIRNIFEKQKVNIKIYLFSCESLSNL